MDLLDVGALAVDCGFFFAAQLHVDAGIAFHFDEARLHAHLLELALNECPGEAPKEAGRDGELPKVSEDDRDVDAFAAREIMFPLTTVDGTLF